MKKKKMKHKHPAKQKPHDQKIRLGYLSSDFGEGPTRDLLPMFFTTYDKLRFEVFAYYTGEGGDTEPFAKEVTLRELGAYTAEEAAETIRRDDIDLLVDLSIRVPDAMTCAIMELHPAQHIISLAADVPQGITRGLPTVEGVEVLSHCYTPLKPIPSYTYRAPLLDSGVPTIGVIGICTSEAVEALLRLLTEVLQCLHAVQIILPARIVEILAEEDIARLAEVGSEAATLEFVDELPYDALDLVCSVDIDFIDVCRAADHSVPVVTATDFVHGRCTSMLLEKLQLPPVRDRGGLAAEVCRLASDLPQISALHECLHWHLFDSFDAGAVMFSVERAYSRILGRGQKHTQTELAEALSHAAAYENWECVRSAAHALDGMEQLGPEQRMSLAWAYFFCSRPTHAGRWALTAEGIEWEREAARLYLSVISEYPPGTDQEIYERARHGLDLIEAGLPAVPEVRTTLLKRCMNYAGNVKGPQTAAMCARQYAAEAEDPAVRRFSYGASLFYLNAVDLPAEEVYQRSLHYGELFPMVQPYSHIERQKKEKIRVGYISGDFCLHVMQYFVWPFLANFDQDSFEVYVYSLGKADQYTKFFQTLVTQWRDLSNSSGDMAEIAKLIYTDEVDILFDLSGHTAYSGLDALAWKPAPVQLSGLGYMATTGLPAVDYFVTDHYCDPEGSGSENVYVEKLLRLTSQFCYNGYTSLPASEGAPVRTKGYIQFASFNQYRKLRDPILLAWRELMERIPQSRLLLKNLAYGDHGLVMMAYARLQSMGFDMSRVMFEPATKDYMLRYLDVDIALDTFPWTGGGTTCDALYMGVPVVSYYTNRHSTRFTYSLLANMGLAELASDRLEDYVETAVALAENIDLLDALHRELRPRMKASPVMDQERYIREMEGCYRAIWAEWEARQGSV